MIAIVALILSALLNIRLAYCLGKHYKYTKSTTKCCQGGAKHLYKKVEEENDISLNDENKIFISNKDE